MSAALQRILRVPLTVAVVWAILAGTVQFAMNQYPPYLVRPGLSCVARGPRILVNGVAVCRSLADLYHLSAVELFVDSMFRSLALLLGAAVLALTIGTLLGVLAALLRRRAVVSGAVVAVTTLLTAVPAFFVAYFLQIAVIVVGANAEGGGNLLPVFGFGYDGHLVLPLLSISLPAIAYTAQLTATRMSDVMDAEFVTTANAKGLFQSWIVRVHVLPHALPVVFEGLGSGLRVSIASLPIVEYIFQWNGIGYVALQSIANRDPAALTASALVLVTLFALLSFIADVGRPRFAYR